MKRLHTILSCAGIIGFLLCATNSSHASHLLGYLFDDPNPTAADGGTSGSAPALNIVGPAVIGPAGSGVSGQPSDRALDNSSATSMGGTINSSGGRATHAADFDSIDSLLQFTIAGWFKTDSTSPIGGNAVLVDNRAGVAGVRVHGDPNVPGNLVLAVDNGSNSSSGFGATEEWVNFAVTYDGTAPQPGQNVFFYAGGINSPLTQVGSGTNTNGSGNDPASNEGSALSLGARVLFGAVDADPFDGLIDNLRIWDFVVPQSSLENLRQTDAGVVPEPGSITLAALAGVLAVNPLGRRRKWRLSC